jgi:hypothetical protein
MALSDALKRLPGELFEAHGHPAVLLDRATSPAVRFWGWWANSDRQLPCLLWCSERGWFATVVRPDEIGAPGYELCLWSHRIKLLDLALANALGPRPSLGVLELNLLLGACRTPTTEAMLWGIVQLRAAHQRAGRTSMRRHEGTSRALAGKFDDELARHGLLPTSFKKGIPGRRPMKHRESWDSSPALGWGHWASGREAVQR